MNVDQILSLDNIAADLESVTPQPDVTVGMAGDVAAHAVTARVGGKASGLAVLHRAGFRVPPTWVIPVGGAASAADLARLATVADRWAVRSSATAEDGARNSYAGVYETRLDVPAEEISTAVDAVRSSISSRRADSYRTTTSGYAGSGVAVILQPFVEPLAAGVWIGRKIGGGRLEWATGRGDRLVSGHCVPDWEEWPTDLPALRAGMVAVGTACLGVQRCLGGPLDLEFAVLPGGLTWLQCRPVTGSRLPKATAEGSAGATAGADADVLLGIAASSGEYTGLAVVLDDPDDPRWRPGSVLVTEHTDPDWVPLMTEAGAVVTSSGGALCHAAIIARELGVPCVTGVAGVTTSVRTGMSVWVDGANGRVRVLP